MRQQTVVRVSVPGKKSSFRVKSTIAVLAAMVQTATATEPTRWIEIPGNGWSVAESGRDLSSTNTTEHRYGGWSRGWAQYTGSGDGIFGDQSDIWGALATHLMPDLLNDCFPFNLGLMESTQPGDFMTPGSTLAEDTLPLLPRTIAGDSTSWNGLSRPTIDQHVDLVTGVPFVQFEDLTLPLGGSQFRLIRSHSADRTLSYRPSEPGTITVSPYRTRWWDWVGAGWMMSENPILLVDSTLPDEVGRTGQPRCKFWQDAFHSISFDWVPTTSSGDDEQHGFYECSPRFRAKLNASRDDGEGRKHSNESGGPVRRTLSSDNETPNAGQWSRFPDKFEVSLFEGEIVYEFTPVWQDLPKWEYKWLWADGVHTGELLTNMHERPLLPLGMGSNEGGLAAGFWEAALAYHSPWKSKPIKWTDAAIPSEPDGPIQNGRGIGAPYYALVTAIRDKFGNRAEIKYTPLIETGNDSFTQNRPTEGDQSTGPKVSSTILQNVNQKGQIREIRLKTADGVTRWTLLYTYRLIPTKSQWNVPGFSAWDNLTDDEKRCWGDSVLDTIYVYEGDVPTHDVTLVRSPNEAEVVLPPAEARQYLNQNGDMIEKYIANELPDTIYWPDTTAVAYPNATARAALRDWKYRCRYYYTINNNFATTGPSTYFIESPAQLMRAQVEQRTPNTPSTSIVTDAPGRNKCFMYQPLGESRFTPWLSVMLDDDDVQRVVKTLKEDASASSWADNSSHEAELQSLSMLRWEEESWPSSVIFDNEKFSSSLRQGATYYFRNACNDGTVAGSPGGYFGQILTSKLLEDTGTSMLPADNGWCTDSATGTVGALSYTDPSGKRRFYRITRFAAIPGVTSGEQIVTAWPGTVGTKPMRSVFHTPYYWQAYPFENLYDFPEFSLSWNDGLSPAVLAGNVSAYPTDYTKARWIVIVDEFPDYNSLKTGANDLTLTGATGTYHSFFSKSTSRQIFGINPQGNVLWKKDYFLHGDRFTEGGDMGLTEKWVYKTGDEILQGLGKSTTEREAARKPFLTERFLVGKKSVGYAAAAIAAGTGNLVDKGLVHVFAYDDVTPGAAIAETPEASGFSWGERIKPVATGICNGDSNTSGDFSTVYYQSRTFYDPTDPTLVTAVSQLTTPVTSYPSAPSESGAILSRSITTKDKDSQTGYYTKISTKSVSPPHRPDPNQPNSKYYDVSFEVTGPSGLPVWSVSATVPDFDSIPSSSSDPNVRVQLTYFKYDDWRGRPTETWSDVDKSTHVNPALVIPQADVDLLPSGLNRIGGGTPPQELRTYYVYDEVEDVPQETHFPNGRVFARRRFTIPDTENINGGKSITRIFRLNDLEQQSGSVYKTGSLCTIEDYGKFDMEYREVLMFGTGSGPIGIPFGESHTKAEKRLIRIRQIWFNGSVDLASLTSYTNFEIKPPIELTYDSSGRVATVADTDLNWDGTKAAMAEITNVGDRIRVKEMDGNASMKIRDARGYLVRTYAGSQDDDWDDNVWHAPTRTGMDMILRSRVEFGSDFTNATLPTKTWSYLNTPSRGWNSTNLAPFGPAPEDDPEGHLTQTRYDWRMRPVRVDVFGPATSNWVQRSEGMPEPEPTRTRLTTRLTYLDHASRPVIEASFGAEEQDPTFLDSVDPSKRLPISGDPNPIPAISSILAKKPLSLVETQYDADGAVKERRTYRVRAAGSTGYQGSSDYMSERFGYGPGGREVFAQRPSSPIQITTLDNLGRTISERSILPRSISGSLDLTFELARTEYGYDADGNVILTANWERIMPGGDSASSTPSGNAALSLANAVCHLTESWYDPSKRLIATANYGTGNTTSSSSGTFVTPSGAPTLASRLSARASAPSARPELSVPGVESASSWAVDRSGVPANVPLTVHRYDRAGNKVGTATQRNFGAAAEDVTYTFTRMEYDAKGRLFVQTDDAGTGGIKRRTKYGYWLGRTVSICSPMTENSTTGADERWQTQGAIYGAEIVAETTDSETGEPTLSWISRDNSLVGAMLSTNPGSEINNGSMKPFGGAVAPTPSESGLLPDVIAGLGEFRYDRPDFAYRYYADGQIAERVDRRRLAMRYFYDDQRRLKEVEIWHYPVTATPPTDYPASGKCAKNIYPLASAARGYLPELSPPVAFGDDLTPVDRIGFISYEYDSRGNTTRVTARKDRSSWTIITDTKYEYDERGNLLKECQAHGTTWGDEGVPVVEYSRQYVSADPSSSGAEHLVSMTYPEFAGTGSTAVAGIRVLNFAYGAGGSADATTKRISSISMGATHIASFGYTGTGRRASLSLGGSSTSPGLWTNFGGSTPPSNALPALDSFGRVRDLHYVNTASTTLWRGEHEYDAAGNRLYEKLTQQASGAATWGTGASAISQPAQSGVNNRSRRFTYDNLDRLTSSLSGTLNASDEIVSGGDAYPTIRSERWLLDKLGNWAGVGALENKLFDLCSWDELPLPPHPGVPGGPGSPPIGGEVPPVGSYGFNAGHRVVFDEGGDFEDRKVWEAHLVATGVLHSATTGEAMISAQPNAINQIHDFGGGEFKQQLHRTDPCGNLVLDDKYYYQYDAWNRLCSVHEKGTLSYFRIDEYGVPKRLSGQDATPPSSYPSTCEWPSIGKLVKHFTYDGVGRLARTSSPVVAPEGWEFLGNENGDEGTVASFTRSERFIYDGVRRIQEIVTDPILADQDGNRVATMSSENDQRGGHGGSGQSGTLPNISVFLRAQYIWGPGDNGVDELLCQIDPYATGSQSTTTGPQGKLWSILTDAQGDVVSIVGITNNLSGMSIAAVAGQWTYSPYGDVLTYDLISPHPAMVFGHKTLAVDRLDSASLTWVDEEEEGSGDWQFFETQRLEPGAKLLAYARNRTLDIQRGRWLQSDPNASGLRTTQLSFYGSAPSQHPALSLIQRTDDGLNLSGYLRFRPVSGRDPLGLSFLADLGASAGVRGMLAGALLNGGIGGLAGLANPQVGFVRGTAVGALSGAFGGGAFGLMYGALSQSAFFASASGLLAKLMISGFTGGVAASEMAQGVTGGPIDHWRALNDGAISGLFAATGGLASNFMRSAMYSGGSIPPSLVPSRALETLEAIRNNGGRPLQGYPGGRVFQNREGLLPQGGQYREFDVNPKPLTGSRDAERIVIDSLSGNAYYTPDHYQNFYPM
ncbi:MAG: hypothetical protein KF691_04125 [Phycisphaeraceae bacterium]|nr:hypothetical protein [Phycisphaeraceae bacterium]